MINYKDIENELGCKTLLTDRMQAALKDWYSVGIDGDPMDHNEETKSLGLPALICSEMARLTTLELEVKAEGSPRADWINAALHRVVSPRKRRLLGVALALGSGIWKPYQNGKRIGVTFVPATGYYPIAFSTEGDMTEAVFVDQIHDSEDYYNRIEWMHVLDGPEDYHDAERDLMERLDVGAAPDYPCVQVISMAFRSTTKDSLGSRVELSARPEWEDIEPIAYLEGLEKLPVGYFVTPIVNPVDPTSEMGAAMFEPGRDQIIDADQQYTRLDWEYEGGELGVDVDSNYLMPSVKGQRIDREVALRKFGVPPEALTQEMPHHRDRLFHGMDVNTGITQSAPFYQVFSPALRDGNYLSGLNQYICHVEDHVGLARGTLSQAAMLEKTATEIINTKQKTYATISDIQSALEQTLRDLVDALDWWANETEDAPPKGEINLTFKWDDSIVIDRLTEMAQWQQEVSMGLRSKVEYRQHFYGEDEATAQEALSKVQQEAVATDILRGVIDNASQSQTQ